MMLPLYRASKLRVLVVAGVLIAVIAVVDWLVVADIPLGFLYLIPMLMLGRVLKPWQTVITAGLLTLLTEEFDTFRWTIRAGLPRDVLYFAAFLSIGIFVYETNRNRQIIVDNLAEIERQSAARQEAEEQLEVLIESSPAAVVTAESNGCILMANEAAHRLLHVEAGALMGRQLQRYLPALSNISSRDAPSDYFRAVMQSRGLREDGESFMADISFSTYRTRSGARLAAMILDASEEMRTREETSLHQMLAGSRMAVGAVSHEIRNVCGAISVVHQNLTRSKVFDRNQDFDALGSLVLALERISAVDLRQYPESSEEVDVASVLDDLKIIIAPSLDEANIGCRWQVEPSLPPVWADRTNLMQIFLNLTNNSIRALSEARGERLLSICAHAAEGHLCVTIEDTGGGVSRPEELFHPFQAAARATGLGLYLSRAFARSFGGDVRYKPAPGKACFVVELLASAGPEAAR